MSRPPAKSRSRSGTSTRRPKSSSPEANAVMARRAISAGASSRSPTASVTLPEPAPAKLAFVPEQGARMPRPSPRCRKTRARGIPINKRKRTDLDIYDFETPSCDGVAMSVDNDDPTSWSYRCRRSCVDLAGAGLGTMKLLVKDDTDAGAKASCVPHRRRPARGRDCRGHAAARRRERDRGPIDHGHSRRTGLFHRELALQEPERRRGRERREMPVGRRR